MRAFIAFEIPEEVKKVLIEAQNQLEKAKLSLTKDFHLTLKFLGEVDETKVEEIRKRLGEIKFNSFETSLTDIGVFPGENSIRVVWVGLNDPESKIASLQKEVDSKTEILGFKKDIRFHPHLTLARVKFVSDKQGFAKNLKEIKIEKKAFQVTEFKLIKSILTPEGPIYEDIVSFS